MTSDWMYKGLGGNSNSNSSDTEPVAKQRLARTRQNSLFGVARAQPQEFKKEKQHLSKNEPSLVSKCAEVAQQMKISTKQQMYLYNITKRHSDCLAYLRNTKEESLLTQPTVYCT